MTRIAVVSMVKAPLRELQMFVHYHLNIGIDEIILFFDNPLDPALKAFAQLSQVTCIACTDKYWKSVNGDRPEIFSLRQQSSVQEGVKIATGKDCHWVIQIDSDELINPARNIKYILDNCHADVLRFKVMEAVSEKTNYLDIFEATLFKNESSEIKIKAARLLGCSQIIYRNEYFRGHTASKVAVKIGSNIRIHGVHGPREYDRATITIVNTCDIALLHFDCVGFDSWNAKWGGRHDSSCNSTTMRENRQHQLEAYGHAKSRNMDALTKLYKRLHIIHGYEKGILFMLGMLTRVSVDRGLFQPR